MKTLKYLPTAALVLALGLQLSGCGKTKRVDPNADLASAGSNSISAPPSGGTPPPPTTTPPSPTGQAPLSYEFSKYGNETYTTGTITTDNVLKVKFKVTAGQGNSVHQATELKVTIAVNGTEVTPTYTSSNYVYGKVGETSNVIDLSSYLSPGVPVTITVKNPMNDFYCTYWAGYYWDSTTYSYQPVNPLYNSYPGCRKAVYQSHTWSGNLIVQTNSTTDI